MTPRANRNLIWVLAVAVSSAAYWFGTGLHPSWPLHWVFLLPVLIASPVLGRKAVFWAVLASSVLGGLNLWSYYAEVIRIPIPLCVAAIAGASIVNAGAVNGFLVRYERDDNWGALAVLPVSLTAWQFLLNQDPINGTDGDRIHSQISCLPILQIASVAGLAGITFVLFLFQAALALTILCAFRREPSRPGLVGLGAVAAVLAWGAFRIGNPQPGPTIRVGLASIDVDGPRDLETVLAYRGQIKELAERGAEIVILPEKIARLPETNRQQIASLRGALPMLVVGVEEAVGGKLMNRQLIFAPGSLSPAIYQKWHLVPGWEDAETPGASLLTEKLDGEALGSAICKDMDFSTPAALYARQGVGLMLVSAWDFQVDGESHSAVAIERGVEGGFSIARSAKNGLMTATDAYGRVLVSAPSNSPPQLALVPVQPVPTLYARFGDWFGWTCVVGYVGLLFSRLRANGSKRSQAPSTEAG